VAKILKFPRVPLPLKASKAHKVKKKLNPRQKKYRETFNDLERY
jgi:hypothetical protein